MFCTKLGPPNDRLCRGINSACGSRFCTSTVQTQIRDPLFFQRGHCVCNQVLDQCNRVNELWSPTSQGRKEIINVREIGPVMVFGATTHSTRGPALKKQSKDYKREDRFLSSPNSSPVDKTHSHQQRSTIPW